MREVEGGVFAGGGGRGIPETVGPNGPTSIRRRTRCPPKSQFVGARALKTGRLRGVEMGRAGVDQLLRQRPVLHVKDGRHQAHGEQRQRYGNRQVFRNTLTNHCIIGPRSASFYSVRYRIIGAICLILEPGEIPLSAVLRRIGTLRMGLILHHATFGRAASPVTLRRL